ncbi:MAG TPA: hypothetical protein ENO25_02460, partial [Desulfobacteraceae bacterium]|nr:hypothetical protein [Desulfobacteraceae bacterium]
MDPKFRAGVLTISDKGSRGERRDESGETAAAILREEGMIIQKKEIVPDDRKKIMEILIRWVDQDGLSLIVTSGGTGLSPTDVTIRERPSWSTQRIR